MTLDTNLETKAGASTTLGGDLDDLMQAFEAFKDANDRRLDEIERRATADPLTTEKVARIERTLDALALKAARPPLGRSGETKHVVTEHRNAFDGYIRKGDASRLPSLEAKALSVGSDPDGGYLVPDETERAVNTALKTISPIRSIAGVRQVSSSVLKVPFATSGAATGWIGEAAARPQTTTPTLAELSFPTMELYAMPAATQSLLDDSAVDIDQWLAEEVRVAFAQQEGTAFISGDGINKPKGFLTYTTVANASWTWGNLGYVASGAAGAFPASNPADKLIDLVYAVKAPYRANGSFVLNRSTLAVIRKMKDADGTYLWQPAVEAGAPSTLAGYPVVEAEDMPSIAADSLSIAFGDFQSGYLIVDRVGIRVLRDPYSAKPYVLFYTTKRVGGGVRDFDAIKLMKFAVS
ncbi:MAG: phage major capsid protein [Hyphomicrobium sp.]|nr:phage major capsid protein [Hyphomicrobium sp.]